MAKDIADEALNLYKQFSKNITDQQRTLCAKLLTQVVENIAQFVSQHLEIHKNFYQTNKTYAEFFNNTFKAEQIKKLTQLGQAQKNLNTINSMRSFGFSHLFKKIFKLDDKSAEKEFAKYLDDIDCIMDSYNLNVKMNGGDFAALLFTELSIKRMPIESLVNAKLKV